MSSSPSAPPHLSSPKIYTSSEIKASPALSKSITHLVNSAFYRSKQHAESKWDTSRLRFPSPDALHAMLDDVRSVMAVVFDYDGDAIIPASATATATASPAGDEAGRQAQTSKAVVVACAAAIPWAGGWRKEGAATEQGWELKTVCVNSDPKYLHRGLAVALLSCLEGYLVDVEKEALVIDGNEGERGQRQQGKVTLWLLVAECINGAYWRKKGFQEVRRRTEGMGMWGCKTEFDMVVFNKEVRF